MIWYGAYVDLNGDASDEGHKKAKDVLVERFKRLRYELAQKGLYLDESKIRWFGSPGGGMGWKVPGTKWEDTLCQRD